MHTNEKKRKDTRIFKYLPIPWERGHPTPSLPLKNPGYATDDKQRAVQFVIRCTISWHIGFVNGEV